MTTEKKTRTLVTKVFEDALVRDPAKLQQLILDRSGQNVKQAVIKNIIKGNEVVQLYTRKKHPSGTHRANFPNQKWYMDLIDCRGSGLMRTGWLLCVIDLYSRFAWAAYIPNKKASTCYDALSPIMFKWFPYVIVADKGPEWSTIAKKIKHGVVVYGKPGNKFDTAPIERFNRTLIEKLSLLFSMGGPDRGDAFRKKLKNVIATYNTTIHSTIKERPVDVFTGRKTSQQVHFVSSWKITKGDKVRLKRKRSRFTKGARTQNLSSDTLTYSGKRDGYKYVMTNDKSYRGSEFVPVAEVTTSKDTLVRNVSEIRRSRVSTRKRDQFLRRNDIDSANIISSRLRSGSRDKKMAGSGILLRLLN